MTSTRRWLAGAGAAAVMLIGLAVPALAQDAGNATTGQATEQSTEASPDRAAPTGDHDCGDRAPDASQAASDAA